MKQTYAWTNASVLALAEAGQDPISVIEERARRLTLEAMDDGWGGPPFDPLLLARRLGIQVRPRGDIPDARTVPATSGKLMIEYNPMRPSGRLRFSIAHEIAHTFFSDCGERARYRGHDSSAPQDNWQLEVLCNVGAAELLMPLGSFMDIADREIAISSVLALRKEFDVSIEACLLRLVKLSRLECAAFGASLHEDGTHRVDYLIPSGAWSESIPAGQILPDKGVVSEANAIGYTSIGDEAWGQLAVHVECIGLSPYPGSLSPRVVGVVAPSRQSGKVAPTIREVVGNALRPQGSGTKFVAHVVPDSSTAWGGRGFASNVRRTFPAVWTQYSQHVRNFRSDSKLGCTVIGRAEEDTWIASMIAQRGFGPSDTTRLRYAALESCLSRVREEAGRLRATVHMPRIGTGHGGGNWELVKELVMAELVNRGVPVTVYTLPQD